MTRFSRTCALITGVALAAGNALAQDGATIAIANLVNADGEPMGTVELTQTPNGVVIEALLANLTPGVHAIHLHDTGECTGDFTSAGGHVAVGDSQHGFHDPDGPHAGDLPNIVVSADGTAAAVFYNDRVGLDRGEGEAALLSGNGSAVIVHEFGDTYNEESDTGARIACGVIEERA